MLIVDEWTQLRELALQKARSNYESDQNSLVRMIGIVLAPGHLRSVRRDILPGFSYWHYRSGRHIDFFWPGYANSRSQLNFDAQAYNRIVLHLQRKIRIRNAGVKLSSSSDGDRHYRYNGGAHLLLINCHYFPDQDEVRFEYSQAIVVDLLKLANESARQDTVAEFLETVFRYAELAKNGTDPTWGFSQTFRDENPSNPLEGIVQQSLSRLIRAAELAGTIYTLASAIR